jgi:hypothetical protein
MRFDRTTQRVTPAHPTQSFSIDVAFTSGGSSNQASNDVVDITSELAAIGREIKDFNQCTVQLASDEGRGSSHYVERIGSDVINPTGFILTGNAEVTVYSFTRSDLNEIFDATLFITEWSADYTVVKAQFDYGPAGGGAWGYYDVTISSIETGKVVAVFPSSPVTNTHGSTGNDTNAGSWCEITSATNLRQHLIEGPSSGTIDDMISYAVIAP